MATPTVPTPAQCAAAAERLAGRVRRTPVLEVGAGDLGPGPVTFKLEVLQHTASFKARGALNAVLTAPAGVTAISAASGGNHGAAVAWAAAQRGLSAHVFVPATVPGTKAALIERYGATLHRIEGFYADALEASLAFAGEHDAHHVDAYDATEVVAGQSSLGRELAEQVEPGRPVLVGVGGGGLFSGVSLALRGRNPVVAVEPVTAPTLHAAVRAGARVDVEVGGIARDSLGARRAGAIAFAVARELDSTSLLVGDDDMAETQHLLWASLRLAVEPGGATAAAAALLGPYADQHPVVVLSGGNVPGAPTLHPAR